MMQAAKYGSLHNPVSYRQNVSVLDQPSGTIGPVWFHLALLKHSGLFAQEEVLSCQCAARPGNAHEDTHEIARDGRQRGEAVCQQLEDGSGHERPALYATRLATGGWAKFMRTTLLRTLPKALVQRQILEAILFFRCNNTLLGGSDRPIFWHCNRKLPVTFQCAAGI
jgi:hypothetical protein